MEERAAKTRHHAARSLVVTLLAAAVLVAACDRIEVRRGADAPDATGTDAPGEVARTERPAETAPDMQSIGPEGAMRVYYQFIDDRGQVRFVERLTDVPSAWRDQVGYVEMDQAPPLTPEEARRSWKVSEERATEILAAARAAESAGGGASSDVILYSADWCGYCTKARRHLDGAGVAYELRDVDIPAVATELREKTGRGGVPVLDFDGEILRGYSPSHYDRIIRSIQG